MNNTRVTEVRSSLGHKVNRATGNLIGSPDTVNTATYWKSTKVTHITTNISRRKRKRNPAKHIETWSLYLLLIILTCFIDSPICN